MDAEAEGQVAVGAATEVECVGPLELSRVAVGGAHHRVDALAAGEHAPAELMVLRNHPCDRQARPVVAQELLDRGVDQFRIGAQPLELAGVLEQRVHAIGQQAGGGLVAAEQDQHAGADQLVLGQPPFVVGGRDHPADHVVARLGAALGDRLAEERRHRMRAALHAFVARRLPARGADEGPHVVGPHLDLVEALARDAEHVEDHPGGHEGGDLRGEVDLVAPRHALEHLVDHAADRRAHRGHELRVDDPVEQAAQPRVLGRVAKHQPHRQIAHHLGEHRAALVLERGIEGREAVGRQVGGHRDVAHVVVARDHPGLERRAPVHRILVAQAREDRERVASDRLVGGVEDERRGNAQCRPPTGAAVRAPPAGAGASGSRSAMVIRCSSRRWPS